MTPHHAIGLVLALYNANVTTDWQRVAAASRFGVPIRAIIPVPHVSPPDPDWAPEYPSPDSYRSGVDMLKASGVEVYAYTHLRNLSQRCCQCCGNLSQFKAWVDTIQSTAAFDGVMLDNNDAPWSAPHENPNGINEMYRPAAEFVTSQGLGVWANGPHVSKDGAIRASSSAWAPYLAYSAFTTLFEMPVNDWLNYPSVNFSQNLAWPREKLGGYVLNIPDEPKKAAMAIERSLEVAVQRGLGWLYPTITCEHRTGSCTYAGLPTYWDEMINIFKRMNAGDAATAATVQLNKELHTSTVLVPV
jgi:hypothetical protein